MTQEEVSKLTDEELLAEMKKMKPSAITNALLIGVLVGVVIYSVAKNNSGFLTVIPLYLAYHLMNNSKDYKAIKSELKERNLK